MMTTEGLQSVCDKLLVKLGMGLQLKRTGVLLIWSGVALKKAVCLVTSSSLLRLF